MYRRGGRAVQGCSTAQNYSVVHSLNIFLLFSSFFAFLHFAAFFVQVHWGERKWRCKFVQPITINHRCTHSSAQLSREHLYLFLNLYLNLNTLVYVLGGWTGGARLFNWSVFLRGASNRSSAPSYLANLSSIVFSWLDQRKRLSEIYKGNTMEPKTKNN